MNEFLKGMSEGASVLFWVGLVFTFIAWLTMLALGALGHVFDIEQLFIGLFPDAYIVSIAISYLGGFGRGER